MAKNSEERDPVAEAWVKRLGETIAQMRKPKFPKQAALEDECGISRAQLSIIETGSRSYSIDPLMKVLAVLRKKPDLSLMEAFAKIDLIDESDLDVITSVAAILHERGQRRDSLTHIVKDMRRDQIKAHNDGRDK